MSHAAYDPTPSQKARLNGAPLMRQFGRGNPGHRSELRCHHEPRPAQNCEVLFRWSYIERHVASSLGHGCNAAHSTTIRELRPAKWKGHLTAEVADKRPAGPPFFNHAGTTMGGNLKQRVGQLPLFRCRTTPLKRKSGLEWATRHRRSVSR